MTDAEKLAKLYRAVEKLYEAVQPLATKTWEWGYVDPEAAKAVGEAGDLLQEIAEAGHAPIEDCYACQGTGKIVGFGVNNGTTCPCIHSKEG